MFKFKFAIGLLAILSTASCQNKKVDIPSGYVGKILTPTGWQNGIHESGQVDIGTEEADGTSSKLILLEATAKTLKEQFLQTGTKDDPSDHRVRTQDGSPLSVDIYVQIATPTKTDARDGIFSMVTATPTTIPRVSIIEVQDIYDQFAHLAVRGAVRNVFASYKNAADVMGNYEKINGEISLSVINAIKQSHAPFDIIGAQISNVKEDQSILDARNKLTAAGNEVQSIVKIGEAIRLNPGYLQARQLDVLEKIGANSKNSLIVMDTKNSGFTLPLKQ